MAFVNQWIGGFYRPFVLPFVGRWIPYLGAEHLGLGVLNRSCAVGWQALSPTSGPLDKEFVQLSVVQEHAGQLQFPGAAANRFKLVGGCALPIIALAYQVDSVGIGSPFAEHPASVLLFMQTIEEMVVHYVRQLFGSGFRRKLVEGVRYLFFSGVDGIFERHQPLVVIV